MLVVVDWSPMIAPWSWGIGLFSLLFGDLLILDRSLITGHWLLVIVECCLALVFGIGDFEC